MPPVATRLGFTQGSLWVPLPPHMMRGDVVQKVVEGENSLLMPEVLSSWSRPASFTSGSHATTDVSGNTSSALSLSLLSLLSPIIKTHYMQHLMLCTAESHRNGNRSAFPHCSQCC